MKMTSESGKLSSKDYLVLRLTHQKKLDTALETFDDSQYLLLNSTLLPFQGIGKDHFFLNKCLPEDIDLKLAKKNDK